MILKLLEQNYPLDEIVYFDIGAEFESIYRNKELLKKEIGKREIQFTELKPKQDFFYTMLEKEVNKRNGTKQYGYKWCGGGCRWGTTLKLEAINKNAKKYKDEVIIEYVGIAIDEQQRILKQRVKRCSNTIKLYPLAEWGMKEKDCLEYCYSKGFNWEEGGIDLYKVLDRVSCWCCRNKNIKELKNIFYYLPQYWKRLEELQSRIDIPFKNNASIFDLKNRFIKEGIQYEML